MIRYAPLKLLLLMTALPRVAPAQTTNAAASGTRAWGILSNYRTVESSLPFSPITARRKLTIAWKDTVSVSSWLFSGLSAAVSQAGNTDPSFGQGMKGYGHRYVTALADADTARLLSEGFLPVAFHEDPRYFRKASGSRGARAGYALTRVLVTRTDKGGWRFNSSEILGTGIAAALGNAYYPDSRGGSDTAVRMATQIGADAASNLLKEFWPDVRRKFSKH